ncbi:MAG: ABC transporter ATP-binding protein [Thermoleophilia bacterium]|nr:ABC transporter ATP-binding protein [Thermoleophilia bacterium]
MERPEPLSRFQIAKRFVWPVLWGNRIRVLALVGLSVVLSVVPALKTELESAVINGINSILANSIEGATFDDALHAEVKLDDSDATGFEGWVLDLATAVFSNANLWQTAASYGLLVAVAALLYWVSTVVRANLERQFFTTLRARAMDTLMNPAAASLPLDQRDERGITVQVGAKNIAAAYTGVLEVFQFLFTLVVTVGLVWSRDKRLAFAIAGVVVAQAALTYIKARHLRRTRHAVEEERDEAVRKSDDIIANRDFVAAHEQQGKFRKKLHLLATTFGKDEQKLTVLDAGYRQFAGVLGDAGRLVILFLAVAIAMGVFGEREEGDVSSIGDAYFLIAIYARMLAPTQGILGVVDGYIRQRDVSRRFRALLTARDELQRTPPEASEQQPSGELAAEFTNVHYAYPTANGPKDALRGCSFVVPRGKTTLIVGRSGSGKTTIARMLLGYLHPDHGAVDVLGRDVEQWDPEQLLLKMSYLAQGDYVVEDEVRVNLFSDMSDAELAEVLGRVRLHDAELDATATELSVGQKQRVGLARLLLDHADIVLMDEPLSGVDAFTLVELDPELEAYFNRDQTFVVISHRLMFTKYADHVVVLEDGVVREQGPRAELERKPGGKYAALIEAARADLGV